MVGDKQLICGGLNEITINVIRCNISTSKSDNCITYITFNCFSITIIFKCDDDIWGVT
jgi:hypothetical protein